jgi:2,4-dienoyl-CoA reductase (NADPH2)
VASFPNLLAPGRIGAMTVRNRVVMSPMETMYGTPEGLPSQHTRDYFAARAKGGLGLITLGATGVDNHHPETRRGRLQRPWPDPQSHRGGRTRRVRYLRRQEKP